MSMLVLTLTLTLMPSVILCGINSNDYVGDELIAVTAATRKQADILMKWRLTGLNGDSSKQLDFWSVPFKLGEEAKIRVPNQLTSDMKVAMNRIGLKWRVLHRNMADLIDTEMRQNSYSTGNHERFLSMNEIDSFVDRIVSGCSHCSIEKIGQSVEGRDIRVVKVGSSVSKPTVFLEGGAHAREWISPATLLYILDKVANDPGHSDLLDNWNLAMVVVLNPDGYEYTHTQSRLWRKNRRQLGVCSGVDLNRNFGYKWGGSGSTSWQCSDLYRGESAFSEPETSSIRDYIQRHSANTVAYVSVHSYGQYWLHPWGYSRGVNPDNVEDLKSSADIGAAALRAVNGRHYRVGHSAELLYPAAGGSDDWAKSIGIEYAYTIELPDTGRYGFVLPPSMIRPVGEETLVGLKGFLKATAAAAALP